MATESNLQLLHQFSIKKFNANPKNVQQKKNNARKSLISKTQTKAKPLRKLIYALNVTLDGCCDHAKLSGHEEILAYHTQLLRDVDLLVYGRKTYQLMVPFWPDVAIKQSMTYAANKFAQTFNAIDRIVFSRSLGDVDEKNTRIVSANPADEIIKLKEEEGKNMLVGGVSLSSQLIALGLVDEYHFIVQPIIVGEGTRLLEATLLPEKLQLKLSESKILASGDIALGYVKL